MRYDFAPKSRTRNRLQYRLLQLFVRFGKFWLAVWDSNRPLLVVYVDQLLRKANATPCHSAEGGGSQDLHPF